jgi:hypothetical protein
VPCGNLSEVRGRSGTHGALLDAFFEAALNDSVDVDTWRMNLCRVEFAGLDDFLYFDHGNTPGSCRQRVKVLRGMAINDVAEVICFPAFDDGKVARDSRF